MLELYHSRLTTCFKQVRLCLREKDNHKRVILLIPLMAPRPIDKISTNIARVLNTPTCATLHHDNHSRTTRSNKISA